MDDKEKHLDKVNKLLEHFMQNPRIKNYDALVNEMEKAMPGQGIKEAAERAKKSREV